MRRQAVIPLLLALAYPILMHTGVILNILWLEWLALNLLAAAMFYGGLAKGRLGAWASFFAVVAGMGALFKIGDGHYAAFLPPPLLLGGAALLFALSLLPGRTPMVTHFAQVMRGGMNEEVRHYTRKVTWLWAVALALLFTATCVVTFFASEFIWSLVTNFLNYAVIAILFVGEFLYRRRRFPDDVHPNLLIQIRNALLQKPLSMRS